MVQHRRGIGGTPGQNLDGGSQVVEKAHAIEIADQIPIGTELQSNTLGRSVNLIDEAQQTNRGVDHQFAPVWQAHDDRENAGAMGIARSNECTFKAFGIHPSGWQVDHALHWKGRPLNGRCNRDHLLSPSISATLLVIVGLPRCLVCAATSPRMLTAFRGLSRHSPRRPGAPLNHQMGRAFSGANEVRNICIKCSQIASHGVDINATKGPVRE